MLFLAKIFPPHLGQGTSNSSTIGLAFLQSGYPGHARKSPYLPCFITIILPHLSQGTSLTLSSITTLETSFSALSIAIFKGSKNSATTFVHDSLPSSI